MLDKELEMIEIELFLSIQDYIYLINIFINLMLKINHLIQIFDQFGFG